MRTHACWRCLRVENQRDDAPLRWVAKVRCQSRVLRCPLDTPLLEFSNDFNSEKGRGFDTVGKNVFFPSAHIDGDLHLVDDIPRVDPFIYEVRRDARFRLTVGYDPLDWIRAPYGPNSAMLTSHTSRLGQAGGFRQKDP